DPQTPSHRGYIDDTATVRTIWDVDGGELWLRDSMLAEVGGTLLPATTLVRRLDAVGRPLRCRIHLRPRFGDDLAPPDRLRHHRDGLVVEHADVGFAISTDLPGGIQVDEDLTVDLEPGSPVTVVLTTNRIGPLVFVPPAS